MEKPKREPLQPLVNVAQLLKEPVGSTRSHCMSGMMKEEVQGFLEGKVKVVRTSRGVLVQCRLTVQVELVCSRCLDRFLHTMSFAAEEEFLPILDRS